MSPQPKSVIAPLAVAVGLMTTSSWEIGGAMAHSQPLSRHEAVSGVAQASASERARVLQMTKVLDAVHVSMLVPRPIGPASASANVPR